MPLATLDAHPDARVVASALLCEQGAVPGIGLGCGEAALGIDRADSVEFGEARPHDARAGARQEGQGAFERAAHAAVQPVEHEVAREQPGAFRSGWRVDSGAGVSPANTASIMAQHATLGASGSHGIEAGRERQDAGDGHATRGRLVTDDAAERRRNAAGAAGIGGKASDRHAVGDRDRGAGRTAAGNPPGRRGPMAPAACRNAG